MTVSQGPKAMIAARVAETTHGGNRRRWPERALITQTEAAAMFEVGIAAVRRAKRVINHGTPEIIGAVERGEIAVSTAARRVSP